MQHQKLHHNTHEHSKKDPNDRVHEASMKANRWLGRFVQQYTQYTDGQPGGRTGVWCILILLSIISLFVDHIYCFQPDLKFENLIPIAVVVWTFTVTMGLYCLEKHDERYFEIRIADILRAYIRVNCLFLLSILLSVEIMVLSFAALLDAKMSILIVTIEQLYTLLYVGALVYITFSRQNVIIIIKKEILANRSDLNHAVMFNRMIEGINYERLEEADILYDILLHTVSDQALDHPISSLRETQKIRTECRHIASKILMLRSKKKFMVQKPLLFRWYHAIEGKNKLAQKQGILMALIEYSIPYMDFINSGNDPQHEELLIWAIIYNLYRSTSINEQWRILECHRLSSRVPLTKLKKIGLEYWLALCEENIGSIETFYTFIYERS